MVPGKLSAIIASLPLLRTRRPTAYVITLVMCAAAWWLRSVLNPLFPPGFPYLTFFPAVSLSSFLFGRGPGSLAAILCGALAWYFFIPPIESFDIVPGTPLALGFYAGVVTVDIALVHWMQQANAGLQRERQKSSAAEERLAQLNATLEHRIAKAVSERQVLADVVENSTAPVTVLSPDGTVLAINAANVAAFEAAFGKRPTIGDDMFGLLADMPDHREQLQELWSRALKGEAFTVTRTFGDKALTQRYFEVRFDPLHDRDGGQIGAVSTAHDVTVRMRAEAELAATQDQLRQSHKMEAVGQLTGGLAHDFNNLLTGITGSLEMITARLAPGPSADVARYIQTAQNAAQRAAAVTHRLLAFSRRQTLDPKATDANHLIREMLDLIRRSVGPAVEISFVPDNDLWTTRIDPNQLENAVLNLVINARDAMPGGGRLAIETSNEVLDPGSARLHELDAGRYIAIHVSDSGIGMTPEVLAKAFDPFFTTKPIGLGTGLGLSMIYGFARQSNGNVRIRSAVGQGSTISLYLPRHDSRPDKRRLTPDPATVLRSGTRETVLVVDDEPAVRMLVVDALTALGYITMEAADGASGLGILQSDATIDLLISDVGLPGGMNGRQMVDAAQVSRPDLRVLFITGYVDNAAVGNGLLEPGMHVMTKPFTMTTLAKRISEIMAETGASTKMQS